MLYLISVTRSFMLVTTYKLCVDEQVMRNSCAPLIALKTETDHNKRSVFLFSFTVKCVSDGNQRTCRRDINACLCK